MRTTQMCEKSKEKIKVSDIMPSIMSTEPYPMLMHASSHE